MDIGCLDETLYESNKFEHEGMSVFSGGEITKGFCDRNSLPQTPIIRAWLDDNDIQEIKIASSNIGFYRTFRKIMKGH